MDSKMKKFIPLFILLGVAFIGFAVYIINTRLGMPTISSQEKIPGFLMGLWQGAIIILSFITSWFDKNITLYQLPNSGFWYNTGYIFGVAIALSGGAKASSSKKSKKKVNKDKE
ncbi:MAG: hypothetical protein WCP14_04195 [bacterium]